MRPILFIFPEGFPLVGGQAIYAYGVLLGLSLCLGWYLTLHAAGRAGLSRERVIIALTAALAAAFLGARGLFFVSNPDSWQGPGSFLRVDQGGLVVYGGLLGGIAGAALASRLAGLGFWRLADVAAPQLALGVAVGRLGCWFYGCDFGRRADGWFAVQFPRWTEALIPGAGRPCGPSLPDCPGLASCDPEALLCVARGAPAWSLHQRLGAVAPDALLSAPVHPVQLYAFVNGLALFVALLWVGRRWRRFHGQLLLLCLGWYAWVRFFLERLREDTQRGAVWETRDPGLLAHLLVPRPGPGGALVYELTTSQAVSLGILMGVAVLGWAAWRRSRGLGAARWLPGELGVAVEGTREVGR